MSSQIVKWCDDHPLESLLNSSGYKFRVTNIPAASIDRVKSRGNHGRFGPPTLEETVENYLIAMKNGDVFPRILVVKMKNGRYMILSGNHREESHGKMLSEMNGSAKGATIEVYELLTNDPFTIDDVTRSANSRHGVGLTREDKVKQAAYMVLHHKMEATDAAKRHGVSESAVRARVRSEESRSVLSKARIDTTLLKPTHLAAIAGLHDEHDQVNLGAIVAKSGMSADETAKAVSRMAAERTRAGRARVIKEIKSEAAKAAKIAAAHSGPGRPKRTKFAAVHSQMRSLLRFLEQGNAGRAYRSLEDFQVTTDARREMASLMKKVATHLNGIAKGVK